MSYSRRNPLWAEVTINRSLSGESAPKDIRHLEIALNGVDMPYKPGDSLGIVPENCASRVHEIISFKGWDPETEIQLNSNDSVSLREAMIHYYDVCRVEKKFLKWIFNLAGDVEKLHLLEPENKDKLEKFTWCRQIIDFLHDYPDLRFPPEDFLRQVKILQPRLYSISSSLLAHPREAHVTVAVVRYAYCDREHSGVCSGFLADRVPVGAKIPVYVHANKSFGLPEDGDTPIIMVGPGTGIAPFRAFLEERRAKGEMGKNWLFFGNPYRKTDYLYEEEFEQMLKEGTLARLATAFSRDQGQKVYVQHRMLENAKEIYDWLEQGAFFYVCGDANRMAKDVHNALLTIIQQVGGHTPEAAEEYVAKMQKEKRYQRDVY